MQQQQPQAEVEVEIEGDNLPYYVSGPKANTIVWGKQYIEGVIIALCHVNGDDEEDYTATLVEDVEFAFPSTSRVGTDHKQRTIFH